MDMFTSQYLHHLLAPFMCGSHSFDTRDIEHYFPSSSLGLTSSSFFL